jgi:hypothetical protein
MTQERYPASDEHAGEMGGSSGQMFDRGNSWRRACCFVLAIAMAQVSGVQTCAAYSVLTHEEIVDLTWKVSLLPLLKRKFPEATDDDLKKAHAFAYGGSLVQDMGYYPFGSKYFSDLTHYVRSGDFVVNLVRDASDLDEYAFALGALAHYSADNCGHPTVNKSVGIEFPKLEKKYGPVVTYEDDPKAHIQTEFGFDVGCAGHATQGDCLRDSQLPGARVSLLFIPRQL